MSNNGNNVSKTNNRTVKVMAIVGYWLLTIFLFLIMPMSAFWELMTTFNSENFAGLAAFAHIFVIGIFGGIPALVAIVLCIISLIKVKSLPDKEAKLVLCLCGRVLMNAALGVVIVVLFPLLKELWIVMALIYGVVLFLPWVIAQRKKLL